MVNAGAEQKRMKLLERITMEGPIEKVAYEQRLKEGEGGGYMERGGATCTAGAGAFQAEREYKTLCKCASRLTVNRILF